jgi:hypothetical protein
MESAASEGNRADKFISNNVVLPISAKTMPSSTSTGEAKPYPLVCLTPRIRSRTECEENVSIKSNKIKKLK